MREKEHNEYNALTKRLLEEGYSAEEPSGLCKG